MSLLDILVQKKLISQDDTASIKAEVQSTGLSLDEVLSKHGISDAAILLAKGEYLQIPTKDLEGQDVPYDILKFIPEESALHYQLVPLDVKNGVLEVGLVDPDNIEARDALNFISGKVNMPFKVYLIRLLANSQQN